MNTTSNLATRIAQKHGTRWNEMKSDSRSHNVIAARKEFAYTLARRGWSSTQIGRLLDRHHTTIISMLGGKMPPKEPIPVEPISCPDFSGEWAI